MTNSASTRLSNLCDFVAAQVDPRSRPEAVYIGLEHIASGRFERIGEGRARDVQSAKYAFQPGDVLYGKLRPYLDKAVLASEAGVCTTELLVLRPKNGVDPRFLVSAVHAPTFIGHAVAGSTGVQHPRTSWNHIGDFEMPGFSPDEQTKIGNLLWEIHHAIAANENALEAGTKLKRAAMRELFTRGLRGEAQKETEIGPVPKSWAIEPIGRFTKRSQYGLSIRGGATGRYPILRMNCQEDGRVVLRDLQYVDLDEATAQSFRIDRGDILFNRTNSYELVGRTAIVDDEIDAVFASYLIRLSISDEHLLPWYLNYFLNWDLAQSELRKLASRAVGQANINATKLSSFPIPVPTIDEQREIVAVLDAIDQKIGLHQKKRAVLDELLKALLHKLMTGEIRVTDLDLSELAEAGSEGGLQAGFRCFDGGATAHTPSRIGMRPSASETGRNVAREPQCP